MRCRETGIVTIEIAIAVLAVLMLIFGIIEGSRWMYAINTLTEATRRGARYAAICNNDTQIQQVTLFGNPTDNLTKSPLLNDLTPNNVSIVRNTIEKDTVTVSIINYSITLNIPLFYFTLPLPPCATTAPLEAENQCSP
jgi:Flp pilus assembly protein TadG